MKNILIIGGISAIVTGMAIGVQGTLTSRSGAIIGAFRTGMITNIFGGVFAFVVFMVSIFFKSEGFKNIPSNAALMMMGAGLVGVLIVVGVSFSLMQVGVTAGLASIILGQMVISTIVDASGWGGAEPIPLTTSRIMGLLVMAVAVYLLLPRN